MKPLLSLCLALVLAVALRGERDRTAERARPDGPRVILYSGENFDGVFVELRPGEVMPHLGDLRFADGRRVADRISSIRIIGPLTVTLFSDDSFHGERVELSVDVPRLKRLRRHGGGSWDNCVSSARVSARQRPRDEWSEADLERTIRDAYRELLERDPEREEFRRCREAAKGKEWRREQIFDHLRDSQEYRRHAAERLLMQVYHELLDRLPTPPERDRLCRAILERGWTEDRLREEIRHTDEYRRMHHAMPDDRRH